MSLPEAILLLGLTGSGKTPLGQELQARGLGGRPCAHFDFGERLRMIVSGEDAADYLSPADREVLRDSLATGELLEEKHFPIAVAILRAFLGNRDSYNFRGGNCNCPDFPLMILNGLPRHAGQAEALAGLVHVRVVVELACDAETATARIRADAGGDRGERVDDDRQAVRRKLDLYARRTAPLLDYYRRQGASMFAVPVSRTMTASECLALLEERWSCEGKSGQLQFPRRKL